MTKQRESSIEHIEQAIHNKETANFLHQERKFADWVVTISFYSCIHFMYHIIINKDKVDAAENIDSLFRKNKKESEGRHGFMLRMVEKKYKKVFFSFKRLYEMSTNARYKCYKYDQQVATKALEYLENIEKFQIKNDKNP